MYHFPEDHRSLPRHVGYRRKRGLFAPFFGALLLLVATVIDVAYASDNNLELWVNTQGQHGIAKLSNAGSAPVSGVSISVELEGKKHLIANSVHIPAGRTKEFSFLVELPKVQGSYPLISTVSYLSDGARFSFKDVGTFHHGGKRTFQPRCFGSDIGLYGEKSVGLSCRGEATLQVIAPDEINLHLQGKEGFPHQLHLTESISPHVLRAPIFFVETRIDKDGYRAIAIQKRWLTVSEKYNVGTPIPFSLLFFTILFGLLIVWKLWPSAERQGGIRIHIIRWAWTCFVVSIGLSIIQSGAAFTDLFFKYLSRNSLPEHWGFDIPWWVISSIVEYLSFEGENYAFFRCYFVYPIFLYVLIINFFTLRYFIHPVPLSDKYWQGMKAFLALIDSRVKRFDRKLAMTSARTLMMKFFFAPLLISWTINNYFHAAHLFSDFHWGPLWLHILLVHLLITLDVSIFTCGYLTELPQLKNTVKSVDATVLGWFVCLVCYPPLNSFFFIPFDHPIIDSSWSVSTIVQQLALLPILFLWMVYVWSSSALGFKASNLSNRGIVSHGPYRFLRHPAYTSKVLIWVIEAVVLGKYYLALCCTFIIVYFLRAWTEERHLMKDPDYLAYQASVPNRFFPKFR
jgi:protein-S-isoprenylcysteine O-methyltransferase Ste14